MLKGIRGWVFGLIALRLLFMALFPVFGDEAYYIYWGQHPAGGYYDLPPMVGWLLVPFVKLSLHPFVLRIPNFLIWLLATFGVYEWVLRESNRERATWAALAFAFLPLPFLAVINFPDVPLLYTGFFAAYFFYRGVKDAFIRFTGIDLLISGALWGAAFLSKYFAVFLIPAVGLWFLLEKKKKWSALLWWTVGALPFVFQHVWWNREHCWANFVFNLITRQKAFDGTVVETTGLFLLYLLLVSAPILFRSSFKRPFFRSSAERLLFLLWSVPVGIFLMTALVGRGQGLHWLMFLTPFFVGWLALRLDLKTLMKASRNAMVMSSGLGAVLLLAVLLPDQMLSRFFEHRFKFEYQFAFHPDKFVQAILPKVQEGILFTEGYTFSSVLNYELQRHAPEVARPVGVWGSGSRFGRVFDWTAPDWKKLDGETMIIITPGLLDLSKWLTMFHHVDREEVLVGGVSIHIARGMKLNAKEYIQREVRKPVYEFYPEFAAGTCSLKTDIK